MKLKKELKILVKKINLMPLFFILFSIFIRLNLVSQQVDSVYIYYYKINVTTPFTIDDFAIEKFGESYMFRNKTSDSLFNALLYELKIKTKRKKRHIKNENYGDCRFKLVYFIRGRGYNLIVNSTGNIFYKKFLFFGQNEKTVKSISDMMTKIKTI